MKSNLETPWNDEDRNRSEFVVMNLDKDLDNSMEFEDPYVGDTQTVRGKSQAIESLTVNLNNLLDSS